MTGARRRWERIAAVIVFVLGVLALLFGPHLPVFDPPHQPPPAAPTR